MKKRVITALVLAPFFLGILYMGSYYWGVLVFALALAALFELNFLIKKLGSKTVLPLNILVLSLFFLLFLLGGEVYLAVLAFPVFFLIYASLPLFYYKKIRFVDIALNYWGIVYVGLFIFLTALRMLPEGLLLTLLLVAGIWAGDIAAYFTGLKLGRHKLTAISPNKTWEGAIGGFVATVAAVILIASFTSLATTLSWVKLLAGGAIIALAGQAGDISQSSFKREAGVKDSGTLLPGHGGLLDRFDGLLFAAPVFYFYCILAF